MLISGEPGIGKSRLAAAILAKVDRIGPFARKLIYNQIFKLAIALCLVDRTIIVKSGFVKVLRASRRSDPFGGGGEKKQDFLRRSQRRQQNFAFFAPRENLCSENGNLNI